MREDVDLNSRKPRAGKQAIANPIQSGVKSDIESMRESADLPTHKTHFYDKGRSHDGSYQA
ncbi:MAG: hypothetical protein DWH73_02770 [Planctomycetota bacterium]|nr:MAG: hypothetical protein DWH73_02770 [Planctomycetota bacterium]